MSYSRVPLAYVPFMSSISAERNSLPLGPTHVTTLVHHDKGIRPIRFAIIEDGHWTEMVTKSIDLLNEGPVDTMAVFFPTDSSDVDVGYLLEGGKPPMFLEWHHGGGPFRILLAGPGTEKTLSGAVGFETIKGILDKEASTPKSLLPGLVPQPRPNIVFGSTPGKPGQTPANG